MSELQIQEAATAAVVKAARGLVAWWMENDVPTREVGDLRDALATLDAPTTGGSAAVPAPDAAARAEEGQQDA